MSPFDAKFMYSFLIKLLSPLIVLLLAFEAIKRKGGWRFFKQRLGFSYQTLPKNAIWIHCASVGEVKAAEPLIHHFSNFYPIIITTNTPTSAVLVSQLFPHQIRHVYLPFDFQFAVQRFLNAAQPKTLWVMETELWPHLYQHTAARQVSITLINARLSAKTLKAPDWLKKAYRDCLTNTQFILARNDAEAQRFIALGAEPKQLQVLGNLKYAALAGMGSFTKPTERDYVLLASSHADEELEITQRWLLLKRPECLVIVPRHPKRSASIQKQLQSLNAVLHTHSLNQPINATTQLYLDDQIGALMPWFAHAKLVIMGGSFVQKGGHNLLEPAALQASILTGPDMSDFESETQLLLQANAVIQCNTLDILMTTVNALLENPAERLRMGLAAQQVMQNQAFILQDYLKTLQSQLDSAQPA